MASDRLEVVERLKRTLKAKEEGQERAERAHAEFRVELEDRLGVGDRPDLRRAFYAFVQDCIDHNGPHVYRRMRLLLEAAVLAQDPGRWFSVAAKATISERGWTPPDTPLGF